MWLDGHCGCGLECWTRYRALVCRLLIPLSPPSPVYNRYATDTFPYLDRLRNDTPPNTNPLPRPLHATRRASARLPGNDSRASHGAGQNWPRERVSGSLHQSSRRVGLGVVLGRVAFPAGRAGGVRSFFSERTVE